MKVLFEGVKGSGKSTVINGLRNGDVSHPYFHNEKSSPNNFVFYKDILSTYAREGILQDRGFLSVYILDFLQHEPERVHADEIRNFVDLYDHIFIFYFSQEDEIWRRINDRGRNEFVCPVELKDSNKLFKEIGTGLEYLEPEKIHCIDASILTEEELLNKVVDILNETKV